MQTIFFHNKNYIPQWYILNAFNKTLGHLATETSNLLRGKYTSFYSPEINQRNYVIIINAFYIKITGKKEIKKIYYKNSQRPGSLKKNTFNELKNKIPVRILEKSIWGMLPKNIFGRNCYKRLYIYTNNNINLIKLKNYNNWKFINFKNK